MNNDCSIITFFLTCADQEESERIVHALLSKKLIACAKSFPVSSQFRWEGTVDKAAEIAVMMDSLQVHAEAIEEVIRKYHSYKSFVLLGFPALYCSAKVREWITSSCTAQ